MMELNQYDIVTATFRPERTDDLRYGAEYWINQRLDWSADFLVEDGPYAGEWAMTPREPAGGLRFPAAWVPLCDLVDVEIKVPA